MKNENFLKKAFIEMKKNAKVQHEIDAANFEVTKERIKDTKEKK